MNDASKQSKPKGRRGSGADTRAKIIDAAAIEFAHKGYDGAMLDTIASHVGIRAASLFHHFAGGKQELFEAVYARIFESLSGLVEIGIGGDKPTHEALLEGGLAFWDYCEQHPLYVSLLLREMLDPESAKAELFKAGSFGLIESVTTHIQQQQNAGLLGQFDPHYMLFFVATHCISGNGAPGMYEPMWPELDNKQKLSRLREHFANQLSSMLAP